MADPLLGFRTITECTISVYEFVTGVLTPRPIALPLNPSGFELNPGITNSDIEQTSCTGEDQIVYTYPQKSVPEISLSFGLRTPEIEGLLINRIAKTTTNYEGYVVFHASATATSVVARTSGNYGSQVLAQSASATTKLPEVYYIDSLTKLAKRLTVVDASPVGDQIAIGAGLALTLSTELVAAQVEIYGHVWCVFNNATILTSESIPLIAVRAIGISFDNTVKLISAKRCAFTPGGSLSKDPKADIKLRVLADGTARTGYGYDVVTLREKAVC